MPRYDRVVVRAFAGEPLERVVCGSANSIVHVLYPGSVANFEASHTGGIGFPWNDVFEFDTVVFERLRTQWAERRDADWSDARPYVLALTAFRG